MKTSVYVFLLVAGICLLLSVNAQAQKVDDDFRYYLEAPFTNTPPQIDGVLSPGEWDGAESATVDWVNIGVSGDGADTSDGPEDCSYTFHVMYDNQFLYIGVAVTDDVYIKENYGKRKQWDLNVAWENDAVEYFFDGDLSRTIGSNRNPQDTATGGQFIYVIDDPLAPDPYVTPDLNGNTRTFGPEADKDYYIVTVPDMATHNWVQEARFALDIIGNPGPGGMIGFNINVDDVDTYDASTLEPDNYTELRDIQLYWFVDLYEPGEIADGATHEDESKWGTLHFLQPTIINEWALFD